MEFVLECIAAVIFGTAVGISLYIFIKNRKEKS